MAEVDWSIGQVLQAIEDAGVSDRTLVIFTSDNGPWLAYGQHAGSAGPLREGKGTSFEGGVRVPTIMCWPGRIPAGSRCDELAATIDLLPTIASLIGAEPPKNTIAGLDISPLMFAETPVETPHTSYLIYFAEELHAVRDRRWKLVFPHQYRTLGGKPGGTAGSPVPYENAKIELSLFDLKNDVGESRNVLGDHPEIAARLQAGAAEGRRMFGDRLTGEPGTQVRGPAKVD
jgi:arylsulfatase A-like enzyme